MPGYALCSWRASDIELVEFGDQVCRDATRTLVYLLNVWCITISRHRDDFTLKERVQMMEEGPRGIERLQRKPGPSVVIWERR